MPRFIDVQEFPAKAYDDWKTTPPNTEREDKISEYVWDMTTQEVETELDSRGIEVTSDARETLIDTLINE